MFGIPNISITYFKTIFKMFGIPITPKKSDILKKLTFRILNFGFYFVGGVRGSS